MFDVAAISAALASSSNPQQVLAELDDEELADLRDETENPELMALLDGEIARRSATTKRGWSGSVVWLVVIALLIASIAAVALRG